MTRPMATIQLPPTATVRDVADAARRALDAFLALDPEDTRALHHWFAGPYHAAVTFTRAHGGMRTQRASQSPIPELVTNAQATVAQAIAAASKPGAEGLVALLPTVVDVVGVRDTFGAHGYAPTQAPNARLASRVLSLLVADYLTRPDDYLVYSATRPTLPAMRAVS